MTTFTFQSRNDRIADQAFRAQSIDMYNNCIGRTVRLKVNNDQVRGSGQRGMITHINAAAICDRVDGAHVTIKLDDGTIVKLTLNDFKVI